MHRGRNVNGSINIPNNIYTKSILKSVQKENPNQPTHTHTRIQTHTHRHSVRPISSNKNKDMLQIHSHIVSYPDIRNTRGYRRATPRATILTADHRIPLCKSINQVLP